MKVYFNCNFTGHKPYERPGKPVVINKSFTWNGYLWLVPAAYEFKEGLVIDFCKRIPMAEAERFFTDWPEDRRVHLNLNEEIELMEQETPFTTGFRPSFLANGHVLESSLGMCCIGWHSLGAEVHYVEDVAKALMEAYHCDRNYAWFFCRMCLNWKQYGQQAVTSLIMTLEPEIMSYTCKERFSTLADTAPFNVNLSHPLTGEAYQLHVIKTVQERLEEHVFDRLENTRAKALDYPKCYMVMEYYMEKMGCAEQYQDRYCDTAENILVMDCAQQEQPVQKTAKSVEDGSTPVASFSIIGGTDGPTAVFIAGKIKNGTGEGENPGCRRHIRAAISSLHFQPVEEVKWRVVFNAAITEPMDVCLIS